MTPEEAKEEIRKSTKFSVHPERKNGGQSVGLMPSAIKLTNETADFEIIVGHYRSQLQNGNLALTLFNLYLDEILK